MTRQIPLTSGGTLSATRAPTGEVVVIVQKDGLTFDLTLTSPEACRFGTVLQNQAGACLPPPWPHRPIRFADVLKAAG